MLGVYNSVIIIKKHVWLPTIAAARPRQLIEQGDLNLQRVQLIAFHTRVLSLPK